MVRTQGAKEIGIRVGRGFHKAMKVATESETTVVCSPRKGLCMTSPNTYYELLQKAAVHKFENSMPGKCLKQRLLQTSFSFIHLLIYPVSQQVCTQCLHMQALSYVNKTDLGPALLQSPFYWKTDSEHTPRN